MFSVTAFSQTADTTKKDINTILEVTNGDYDMGKISIGKSLEYNVYLKNISTADTLIIQDIRVGCGCTTPKFKTADKILPGKSTFITLGFNGGSAPGDFSKFADILFRGGLVKQVKFHGTAVPPGQ